MAHIVAAARLAAVCRTSKSRSRTRSWPTTRSHLWTPSGIGQAHVVGWSDGANVGMITAMRRPYLVRKLVLIGTAVNVSGGKPWAQALMEHFAVDHLPPMWIEEYAALSPDGRDHFPVVFKKVARALIDTPQTLADLVRISAPTLIMVGDDDLVAVEHLEAMRVGVPDA